jgi:hypothetical protein
MQNPPLHIRGLRHPNSDDPASPPSTVRLLSSKSGSPQAKSVLSRFELDFRLLLAAFTNSTSTISRLGQWSSGINFSVLAHF